MSDLSPDRSAAWERVAARPHVVVISDDRDLQDFFVHGLLMAGFWTSAIASGIQAIEVYRMRRFDLILIDAHIAGLPAVEIIRRLRGRSVRGREGLTLVPVLVVGADSELSGRDRYLQAGVEGFVDPPVELEEVAVRLMAVVAKWRTAHPDEPWADAPLSQSPGPRDPSSG